MSAIPSPLKIVLVFIILGIGVMFVDGLAYNNLNSRLSMAMMHMEMRPVMYPDPAPPSLEEYWAEFSRLPSEESNPDEPLEPEIIVENGSEVKLYRLTLQNVLHELRAGVKTPMFAFNGKIPGPTIRVREGDRVRVVFTNNGTDPHTIHWHGINNITNSRDGVPDLTQEPVLPGERFTYEFTAGPSGTKFYHCHVEAPHHIQMGMFGSLIVDPLPERGGSEGGNPFEASLGKEYTLLLSEFDARHDHAPYPGDMMPMGPDTELPWLITPGRKFTMPFNPDMNEFLINGRSFPYGRPIRVEEGDIVRLRLANVGLQTHSIHLHGHEFVVTHRDGYLLPEPFRADTLLIGQAERYDAWFRANNPGLWMLHDHGMGNMANGYDPAGIMAIIQYEGYGTQAYDRFLERVHVYTENIEHMDDDHGRLTPSTPVGGGHEMEGMEGGH